MEKDTEKRRHTDPNGSDAADRADPAQLSKRLRNYFTFIVFAILSCSTLSVCIIALMLNKLGVFDALRLSLFMAMLALFVLSILIGTTIALIFGDTVLRPLNRLSAAMSRVSKGDFSVRLDENSHVKFVRRMNRDFNHMVDELSTVETLRDDFISNVSHEFKTPLSSIEGYAMLLQDRTLPPETEAEYVERILVNSGRLSTLVGNILMLSKIENQTIPMEKNTYRIDEQVRQVIVMMEPKWNAKDVSFDMEMDSIEFSAIELLMNHVFSNLIDNAIKFSPEHGTVYIELTADSEALTFRIANGGTAMDDKTLKRIFEKFYQGDTSHKSEGNGLGLSLVNKIVRLHNGSVSASVTNDGLNEFKVILPTDTGYSAETASPNPKR